MILNIPPSNSFGKETLVYWEDFLTVDELNYLCSVKEWSALNPAAIGGASDSLVVDPKVRETGVNWLYPNDENKRIWEKISETVVEVNRRFFRFNLTGFYEPMQLGLYHSGNSGHYSWHVDSSPHDLKAPRKLSMALMLSDTSSFSGGQLQVKIDSDTPISVEQKRGRAWFFPSYCLHSVTPVTQGFRQSAVLWVGGPEFV